MEPSYWNDQPILTTEQDRFDFADYAEALSRIVLTGSTPLTIGIFGPWGYGKTSLMRLIAASLTGRRTAGHRLARIIWFNAWQYERDQGAMWRSLLLRVLEELKTLDLAPEDLRQIEDWAARLYTDVNRKERGALQIDWPQLGKGLLRLSLSLVPSPTTLLELLKVADSQTKTLEDLAKAFTHAEVQIYRRQLTLLEEFQSGFAQLVKKYVTDRNGLLVIFVDDLDRCLPDRALEVLETIKLFLDVPGCAFFLAADQERVESVVRGRYGEQQHGAGQSYLEKLVQLPFYLPPLEVQQMGRFVAEVAPDLPRDVRRVFAAGLAPNPRMIKRVLNIFRLLQELAAHRLARGTMEPLDLTLLAKMVVIQARYRELYHDLLEYPNLIQELEVRAVNREEELPTLSGTEAPPLVAKYSSLRPLMRMLRIGTLFASLTTVQIGAYLHLTLSTGQEALGESDPFQRLWDDLCSNDLTRIRAGVGVVRQQGASRKYAAALALLVTGERAAPLRQRISAARALGYLGDPRDFEAVVEIPGGEFLYGEQARPRYLRGYRIGRYLVTNAQYARFIQAHPQIPVPYVNEDWARPYNWDPEQRGYPEGRDNMPVTLVTWEEAQAYCLWVGGRLPTEEEWERAARGDNGRTFPWGETADPAYANTRESGIGSVTPVGIYLEGASPYGLLDVAGNIWEWTESDFTPGTKVIRGGAWNFPLEAARTFIRERSRPENRSNCIGFRVAFAIPGSAQAAALDAGGFHPYNDDDSQL